MKQQRLTGMIFLNFFLNNSHFVNVRNNVKEIRMKKVRKTVNVSDDNYMSEALDFVRQSMQQFKIPSSLLLKAELLTEELILSFVKYGAEDMPLEICVKKRLGDVHVNIEAPGKKIDALVLGGISVSDISNPDMDEPALENAIRSIVINAMGKKVKYAFDNGINSVSIAVGKAERSFLILTLYALVLGIIAGLIINFLLPGWLSDGICNYALIPVKTMFMNALKIIIGPVVFFSIVTCFSQFNNLSELGKVGAKVMGMYVMTTTIAAMISFAFSELLHPGNWGAGLGTAVTQTVAINTETDTSILSTIINIIPDNFVKPFLESNTLQLIFLGVICGIAVGALRENSKKLAWVFESLNELFLTITTMISKFIPLAAFCSVVLMIVDLSAETFVSLLGMIGTFFICLGCIMLIYGLLIMLIGHLSPVMFFRKVREAMITSFVLSSSSASIPTSMKVCTNKLGVSPKIASFSIPLGSTINMDGTTIVLIVMGLFLARMYAIPVSGATMASFIFTVILLSLGSPGVPSAALVCLGIAIEHLGVPIEALGMVIAIYPFIDMFTTMNNITGDIAVATIVAKSEGMLDLDMYNKGSSAQYRNDA